MKWINVLDRLPEIPEGSYGVSCTVLMYDAQYADACNCNGYSTTRASFDLKSQVFLQQQCFHGKPNPFHPELGDWLPTADIVTHWLEMSDTELPPEPNHEELEYYYAEYHERHRLNYIGE